MKTKSAITIISISLNLVLFSVLAYFNKIDSHTEGSPAPFFLVQHMTAVGYAQNDSHEIALVSTGK